MSASECVALEMQLGLSQYGMRLLYNQSKKFGQNGKSIFPTYGERLAVRRKCIP